MIFFSGVSLLLEDEPMTQKEKSNFIKSLGFMLKIPEQVTDMYLGIQDAFDGVATIEKKVRDKDGKVTEIKKIEFKLDFADRGRSALGITPTAVQEYYSNMGRKKDERI
jgi:L-fucose mutarotase/ribose pyranase (RbsD/FucU family)